MNLREFLLVSLCLMAVAALSVPVAAQIESEDELVESGFAEGGQVLTATTGGDPQTFNPIISSDGTSSGVWSWMYPSLIGVDPFTGQSEPNLPNSLATGWEFSDDGLQVTISLRDDVTWSDGTPITAADYLYTVNAIRSGETTSARFRMFDTLADGTPVGGRISTIEAPDPYTLVVTFSERDCLAFDDINNATPVPAHIFEELYGEDYALMDEDPRRFPEVTWGPFHDLEFEPAQRISLLADPNYTDGQLGFVSPSEYVILSVPDENIAVERFKAGEFSIMAIPGNRQNEFRGNPDFQTYEFTGNGFVFMAMNNADPADPQPGLDTEGNPIPQAPHPVFGDVTVRLAVTQAIDVNAIIQGLRDGYAVPVATHTIPTSWVYNPDMQYEFDPEAAMALLDEAGWVDHDNNPDTPRVCQGCLYAREVDPEFEGSPLEVRLRVPDSGEVVLQLGEFLKQSLDDVGFNVDFQAVDWATAFLPELDGQTFDLAVLSWSLGLPIDPDVSNFYTPGVDIPGSGFNFTSFYNEELNELLEEGRRVEGCAPEDRAPIYERVQEILFEEAPYMYLYVSEAVTAVQPDVLNWMPAPFSRTWQTDSWIAQQPPQ